MLSKSVKAKNKEQAKIKFIEELLEDELKAGGATSDSSGDVTIDEDDDNIEIINIIDEHGMTPRETELQWLTSSSILPYNFLPEERKFLKDNNTCVEDNLCGIYSPLIKKINVDYIRELGNIYYKDEQWNYTKGYNAHFIKFFCEKHNISMYAFDILNKCFLKHVTTTHRKYPALFFYAINGHMYLIKDQAKCKSLLEVSKAHSNENFNTSIIELKDKKNIFEEFKTYNEETKETIYKIEDNIKPEDILKYESRIFMYSKPHLNNINEEFYKCINLYGIPSFKSIISDKTNITRFDYKINGQLYVFMLDSNDCVHVNYKMVMYYCLKNEIEFKNQTFPALVKQCREKYFKSLKVRQEIPEEDKSLLVLKSQGKCNLCKDEHNNIYEIDHIRPIANGGDPLKISNLQVLCKSCHHDKTRHEQEDGTYVRIVDSESSFNTQVKEIFDSEIINY